MARIRQRRPFEPVVEPVVQGVVWVAYGYCLMDAVEGLTELDEFDALFDLHPDEFVAGRDALVKQLRSEKRRDEAAGAVMNVDRQYQLSIAAILYLWPN